jgi:Short C-terminal domain
VLSPPSAVANSSSKRESHRELGEGEFVEQLAAFAKLRADGVLADEEFKALKAELIGPLPTKGAAPNEFIKHLKKHGAITEDEFQSKVLASLSSAATTQE